MSEQQPEKAEDDKPGIIETIRSVIADELGKLFEQGKADVTEDSRPGGNPAPGRDRSDVSAAVRAEVEKLRADEARQAASTSMEERVAELERKLKPIVEAVPEEYRKITQAMWG